MVRLKENIKLWYNENIYGFQFLMVRLKEAAAMGAAVRAAIFQFLMVRLKECLILFIRIIKKNFNSLWCD